MLSNVRDQAAAERFLLKCEKTTGVTLVQVTTDKEADHRGIKPRYKAMKGFKNPFSALHFCTMFDEMHQHFRMKNTTCSERRGLMPSNIQQFAETFMAS